MSNTAKNIFNKPHFELLDGLRGVAALMVVWYHVFEGFAFAGAVNGAGDGSITTFNHGYLAVDFFFMLSGFVISYAYDDRWKMMGIGEFFKRRLVRLHPMVIMGAIIGTTAFCIGGGTNWGGESAGWHWILTALVLGMLLIPAIPGARNDVRGNGEMFPLNGPSWSLFFEYLGNIIYALIIRRFSTRQLKVATVVLGVLFAGFAVLNLSGYGSVGVGWTLDTINFFGGLLRMLFPFTLGMTLHRALFANPGEKTCHFIETLRTMPVNVAFICCSVVLFALFSVPFLGADERFCTNGIFEFICIAVIFPAIVTIGAACSNYTNTDRGTIKFLGELSYPLYIVHYPVMYLFYSWLIKEKIYGISECWPIVCGIMLTNIAIAYLCLKLYDQPVRKRAARWLMKQHQE